MNLDLTQILRDYQLLTKEVTNSEEASALMQREFNIDDAEVVNLWYDFYALISNKFDLNKMKKKELAMLDDFIALMYDAFFFGMYVNERYT